jgi:hypothetical protein
VKTSWSIASVVALVVALGLTPDLLAKGPGGRDRSGRDGAGPGRNGGSHGRDHPGGRGHGKGAKGGGSKGGASRRGVSADRSPKGADLANELLGHVDRILRAGGADAERLATDPVCKNALGHALVDCRLGTDEKRCVRSAHVAVDACFPAHPPGGCSGGRGRSGGGHRGGGGLVGGSR